LVDKFDLDEDNDGMGDSWIDAPRKPEISEEKYKRRKKRSMAKLIAEMDLNAVEVSDDVDSVVEEEENDDEDVVEDDDDEEEDVEDEDGEEEEEDVEDEDDAEAWEHIKSEFHGSSKIVTVMRHSIVELVDDDMFHQASDMCFPLWFEGIRDKVYCNVNEWLCEF